MSAKRRKSIAANRSRVAIHLSRNEPAQHQGQFGGKPATQAERNRRHLIFLMAAWVEKSGKWRVARVKSEIVASGKQICRPILTTVRLTDEERVELQEVVKKLKGSSEKVRRAEVLLKADANGPNWTDERIAEAFSCRVQTVEQIRQRLVERGFRETLDGAKRKDPPTAKLLTGEQEAKIIAMRLGPAPKGYANWTLRLLARKVVELEIVDSISHETIRRTLKKTG